MILIAQGESNTVVLTLSEKTTLINPVYLFVLTGTQTNIRQAFIAADTSEYKDRYNCFTITETASPNPLQGQVQLTEQDFWHYQVYAQSSAENLDPALADELVETGIVYVTGTGTEKHIYNQQPINAYVYNG